MTQNDFSGAVDWAQTNLTGYVADAGGNYKGECISLVKRFFTHLTGRAAPATGNGWGSGYWSTFPEVLHPFYSKQNWNPNTSYPKGSLVVNTPTGHIAILISNNSSSATVYEQNADGNGSPAHVADRPDSHLNGVLVPIVSSSPHQSGKTLHLPPDNVNWHVYKPQGPYDIAQAIAVLHPQKFGGLSYPIQGSVGNGIYLIDTKDFGRVAIWTNGTDASIN